MYGRYTSEQLKKIAMGTMLLDHAAVAVIYNHGLDQMYPVLEYMGLAMRLVGRMAFPLYAFLLVQGMLYTRDWKKYVGRVAVFAVLAEVPFNLVSGNGEMIYLQGQSTLVTMVLGLLCMKCLQVVDGRFLRKSNEQRTNGCNAGVCNVGNYNKGVYDANVDDSPGKWNVITTNDGIKDPLTGKILRYMVLVECVIVFALAAIILRSDYHAFGILLIMVFYWFRNRPVEQFGAGMITVMVMYGLSLEAMFAWIAFFFINRYNGEKGRHMGYWPYVFYPVHLLAVYFLGEAIAVGVLAY